MSCFHFWKPLHKAIPNPNNKGVDGSRLSRRGPDQVAMGLKNKTMVLLPKGVRTLSKVIRHATQVPGAARKSEEKKEKYKSKT